jgi:hypothetical protein
MVVSSIVLTLTNRVLIDLRAAHASAELLQSGIVPLLVPATASDGVCDMPPEARAHVNAVAR